METTTITCQSRHLTPRQQRFVAEYLIDQNATQAAIRAGYSPKTARAIDHENLTKPDIAAAIAAQLERQLVELELSGERVLTEVAGIAFSDLLGLFDHEGNIRPLDTLTPEQAAAIASFEVVEEIDQQTQQVTRRVSKVKFWDKVKAVELLAKHFKLLTDQVHVSDDAVILDCLEAGRQRVAEMRHDPL